MASEDDVVQSAHTAQPLAQCLADAAVGHMTRELAETRVEDRLERQEGRVGEEQHLVEQRQDHVGPRLWTGGEEKEGGEKGAESEGVVSVKVLSHLKVKGLS